MLKLKQYPGSWKIEPTISKDFIILNEEGKNVADAFSGGENGSQNFPNQEEANFNALLISKAPEMAQALINISSQLEDRGSDEIIRRGIEVILKDLTL